MTEKIMLTLNANKIYGLLNKHSQGSMNYQTLRDLTGIEKAGFTGYLTELRKKGLVTTTGPHCSKTIHVAMRPKDLDIEISQKSIKRASAYGKPRDDRYAGQEKKRGCLKCKKSFTSKWPGERICKVCKTSRAWTNDSPYTPSGDGDGFGVSDLVTGVI
ncbi:hypothetical protein [Kiloniella majae]|uniref:hypothetical protein n=1 Tax=Kiloniella majae TaxID=1938558 RepID=UPI000A27749C|nr:hypothetical protein [Kiloniella majae]